MKVSETQKSAVLGWIEKWRPRLFLQNYRIECQWRSRPAKGDSNGDVTYAESSPTHAGLDAEIDYFPDFWKWPDSMREKITVHELAHITFPSATENEVNILTEILWTAYKTTPSSDSSAAA